MRHLFAMLLTFAGLVSGGLAADEFRHVGDYVLKSRTKIAGDKSTPIIIKPMLLRVYSNGIEIRVTARDDAEAQSTFQIYRSDGIGRQRAPGGPIDILPGVQASTQTGGVLRHLRLSRESLTITSFPGVSDQTIISYAIGIEPGPDEPPAPPLLPEPDPG